MVRVLVINCGSSSVKYKLFAMPREQVISKGIIEHIGEKGSEIKDHYLALKKILAKINRVALVGHRVVHGAEEFKRPVLINQRVIHKIKKYSALAPLHHPANLAGISACKKLLPDIKQVAVFDTAFHQTLPDYAYLYGLPYEYYQKFGIRKYGFHGSSHQYVAQEAARKLKRPLNKLNLITCHLGNGCSITAVKRGKSIDTSMGFTPLEGLMMGTRCGDIDPALVTYMVQKKRFNIRQINAILNQESGLKGISGISNDLRVLSKKDTKHKRVKLAINMFVYRVRKYIGSYIAVMGSCDAVVFTAGIGENQRRIRKKICQNLFSHLKKKPQVLVIPTDEELMIAREAIKLIRDRSIGTGPEGTCP